MISVEIDLPVIIGAINKDGNGIEPTEFMLSINMASIVAFRPHAEVSEHMVIYTGWGGQFNVAMSVLEYRDMRDGIMKQVQSMNNQDKIANPLGKSNSLFQG